MFCFFTANSFFFFRSLYLLRMLLLGSFVTLNVVGKDAILFCDGEGLFFIVCADSDSAISTCFRISARDSENLRHRCTSADDQ